MPIIVENNPSNAELFTSVTGSSSHVVGSLEELKRTLADAARRVRDRPRPRRRPRGVGRAGRHAPGHPAGDERHPDPPPRGHQRARRSAALRHARGGRGARPDRPRLRRRPRQAGLAGAQRSGRAGRLGSARPARHRLLSEGRGRQDHPGCEPGDRAVGEGQEPGLRRRPRPRFRRHRDHPPADPRPHDRGRRPLRERSRVQRPRAAAHPAQHRHLGAGGAGAARRQGLHPRRPGRPDPEHAQGQLRLRHRRHRADVRRVRAAGLRRDRPAPAGHHPWTCRR